VKGLLLNQVKNIKIYIILYILLIYLYYLDNSDDVVLLTHNSNYVHGYLNSVTNDASTNSKDNNNNSNKYLNSVSNHDGTTSSKENDLNINNNSGKKQAPYKGDSDKQNHNKFSPALNPSNKHNFNKDSKENNFLFKQATHINTTNSHSKIAINNDKTKSNNVNLMRNSTDQILNNIQSLEYNLGNKLNSGINNNKFSKLSKPTDQKIVGSKDKEVKLSNQLNTNPHQANLHFNNISNITNNVHQPQEIQFNNIANSNYIANINLNINSNNPGLLHLQNIARQQINKLDQKKMFNDIDSNTDYLEDKLKNRVLNNKNQQGGSNKSFNNSGGNTTNIKKNIKKKTKSNSHMSDHLSMEEALVAVTGEKRSASKSSNNNDNKSKLQRGMTNVQISQRSDSKNSKKGKENKREISKEKEIDIVMHQLMKLEDKIIKTKNKNVTITHLTYLSHFTYIN